MNIAYLKRKLRNLKKIIEKYLWKNSRDLMISIIMRYKNNRICENHDFIKIYVDVHCADMSTLSFRDMYNIWSSAKIAKYVCGDMAEVGVYKGGSAKIICEVKGDKKLFLFDTYEGMPDVDKNVDDHEKGDFNDTDLDRVKQYLSNYQNIEYIKGTFPESLNQVWNTDQKYCFVHLDVDIYKSTLNCLEYFYPRMSPGGIIISHDYKTMDCTGVKKAFTKSDSDSSRPIPRDIR